MRTDHAQFLWRFLDDQRLAFQHRLIDGRHGREREVVLVGNVHPAVDHRHRKRAEFEHGFAILDGPLTQDVRLFRVARVLYANPRTPGVRADLLDDGRLADTSVTPQIHRHVEFDAKHDGLQQIDVEDVGRVDLRDVIVKVGSAIEDGDRDAISASVQCGLDLAELEDFVQRLLGDARLVQRNDGGTGHFDLERSGCGRCGCSCGSLTLFDDALGGVRQERRFGVVTLVVFDADFRVLVTQVHLDSVDTRATDGAFNLVVGRSGHSSSC